MYLLQKKKEWNRDNFTVNPTKYSRIGILCKECKSKKDKERKAKRKEEYEKYGFF